MAGNIIPAATTTIAVEPRSDHRIRDVMRYSSNAKLTDDEERAKDVRNATCG